MTRRRIIITWILGGTLILVAGWLASSLVVDWLLTARLRAPYPEPAPRVAWGTFEELRLKTSDGEDLGAWFMPGRPEQPAVLLLHGQGGSRTGLTDRTEMFAQEGFSVLLITRRAHGDSSGRHHDFGYSSRCDVLAGVEYLERRRPGGAIFLYGESAGAASAAYAAEQLGHRVSGYILDGMYCDLRTAVWHRVQATLPPPLAQIAYSGLVLVAPVVHIQLDQCSPLSALSKVPPDVPVLLLTGSADRHCRVEEGQALYERVRSHGKLVLFEGSDHGHLFRDAPARYKAVVMDFIWNGVKVEQTSAAGITGRIEN